MNSLGETTPRSGEVQRASASKPSDPSVAEVDDRLEDRRDLVPLQRALKRDRELVAAPYPRVHLRLVVGEAVLSEALGAVHRHVRVLQELGRALRRRGRCDADAAVHARLAAPKHERLRERVEQRLGDDRAAVAVARIEQDGKLVAAEAGRGVTGPDRALDTAADLGQHLVADSMAERVVDRLEVIEVQEQHDRGAVAATERRLDLLGEERPVREPGEDVVEGLVAQPLLQVGHLGQRAFEPAVLEHHARMSGEGLEQPLVVGAERVDVTGPVADDEDAEGAVLAEERRDDRVRQRALAEVAVERVERPAGRQQQRFGAPVERGENLSVAGPERVGMRVHLTLRAEGAAEALFRARRDEEDLGVLGAHELPHRDQKLADGEAELRRALRRLHRLVEELEVLVPLGLSGERPERQHTDRDGNREQDERAPVGADELDRDQDDARHADRRHDRDAGGDRELAQIEASLRDRDCRGDKEDPDDRRAHHGKQHPGPAGDPEGVAVACDRTEDDQRHRGRQRELGDVEDELRRALAADEEQCCCRAGELRTEEPGR